MKGISVNRVSIDTCLWNIQRHLMDKVGVDESYQLMAPLTWYVNSGRASGDFIRHLMVAKSFMVARKLRQGGAYDEVITRVKSYIGYADCD